MSCYALALTHASNSFIRCGFYTDLVGRDSEGFRQPLFHRGNMGTHLGSLRDDRGVYIAHDVALGFAFILCFSEDFHGVDTLKTRIVGREIEADVGESQGAE